MPAYDEKPEFYSDWGDPREFTTGDMGVGECAGEVVSTTEFNLAEAERIVFDAQTDLDEGKVAQAAELADKSMLLAAKGLVHPFNVDVTDAKDDIVGQFRTHLHDTKRFHDPFAGAKFAEYFFDAMANPLDASDTDAVRRRVEEATLFIESSHSCNNRLAEAAAKYFCWSKEEPWIFNALPSNYWPKSQPPWITPNPAIPVLHSWIQQDKLTGLPIDVADYRHVEHGLELQLIGHEGDYLLDKSEFGAGLTYSRKRLLEDELAERLDQVAAHLKHGAELLGADERMPGLGFDADAVYVIWNDRLQIENSDSSFQALAPDMEAFGQRLFGAAVTCERISPDPRQRLIIKLSGGPATIAAWQLAAAAV